LRSTAGISFIGRVGEDADPAGLGVRAQRNTDARPVAGGSRRKIDTIVRERQVRDRTPRSDNRAQDRREGRLAMEGSTPTTSSDQGLAREAIGLREVFFQSVTHMAPAAAVAFSIIVGANFASGALPLSVIFALVGCLLVAISIGQLAKHLPSAGGFYTYTARGIHPSIGFLVAWGYAFVEPLVAPRCS
jgi:hypothetical protein